MERSLESAHKYLSKRYGVKLLVPNANDVALIEKHETFIEEWVKDGVGIDIGACVGSLTLPFAARNPLNFVVAIEPQTDAYLCLLHNICALNLRNVLPLKFAISDKNGKIDLNIAHKTGNSSLLDKPFGESSFAGFETVNMIRLDDLISLLHLNSLDWIKIDTEGYEPVILKTLPKIAETFEPDLIIEYHNNLKEVSSILKSMKYTITVIRKDSRIHGWLKSIKQNEQ